VIEQSYARITRAWKPGDVIDLDLPMPVRRVIAHGKVVADRGRVALERGPVVFCAEGVDHAGGRVLDLVLPDDNALTSEYRGDLLKGVQVIRGKAFRVKRRLDGVLEREKTLVDFTAIPYYAWCHRGRSPMTVWPARTLEAAKPAPAPTLAHTGRISSSSGRNIEALTDQLEPSSSNDHSNSRFHWWPNKGTAEWVQLDFADTYRVHGAKVYWFDDTGIGACRVPDSWRLLYRKGETWKPVTHPSAYGVAADRYNRMIFDPVTTNGLRLEVQLQAQWSAGIHELVVVSDSYPQPVKSTGSGATGIEDNGATLSEANAAANPVTNPSFEEARGAGQPAGWRIHRWGGKGTLDLAPGGRTGSWSVKIASADGADLSYGQSVAVRPYSKYRLSGWIRTEGLEATTGKGALFNLHTLAGCRTPVVTGTRDWTRVEMVFDTEALDVVLVNCLFGGWGFAKGTAWYDDVTLELLETRVMKPEITITAGREGAPISKYIYGQFIEHLGRCIYGGIWAEMLEDRKFFYPVGCEQSPWRTLGPAGAVSMSKHEPYVGDHTPEITSSGGADPAGLVQGGLGLVKGKSYTGRIVLAGTSGTGSVRVDLVWGPGEADRDTMTISAVGAAFRKAHLRFEAGESTDVGHLQISAPGAGILKVGAVSLMPAENVKGMRCDTLALLRELNSPVYRWPGGNFVSGYDWKDGIGDPDRRPPRKNPAWTGVEHNDFGIHEFMNFCALLGTEPYVTVNTGQGTVEMAANEVEYFNGAADTPMGRWRARNGHPEPWNVTWWAVGNEMYGGWQLGHMPLEEYVKKHNIVVDAMRAKDPSIRCVAVGAVGKWTEVTLQECSAHMELISEHFYVQELPGVMGHSALAPRAVKRICDAHRRYRKTIPTLAGKEIPIALDEWNYWYGPHLFGELGTRYFWKDGLGVARGLHEYFRNSDIVFMANYAQTVNVIGCIKTSKTAAAFATTGQVLKLYRQVFGEIPLEVSGAPEPLDVCAAWTGDRSALTLAVINPTTEALNLPINWQGIALSGKGRAWRIGHVDPMAYNEPGRPDDVFIDEFPVDSFSSPLEVPSLSVTIYRIES